MGEEIDFNEDHLKKLRVFNSREEFPSSTIPYAVVGCYSLRRRSLGCLWHLRSIQLMIEVEWAQDCQGAYVNMLAVISPVTLHVQGIEAVDPNHAYGN
ncbi:hypothetical protein NL676_006526 [Syzygium grande]|nr:hypothetical protein NL676_006526 [Syzygium grande]